MVWSQIEATPSHLTYLLLSTFLIIYALFSEFIRNRLHISEPPLATLLGIAIGPKGTQTLSPRNRFLDDGFTQEVTRIIVGVQVFAVGIELPKAYLSRHWKSVGMMLGPVMTFSFMITALFVYLILRLPVTTCLIISACLAPTDPVLAASVLAESHFSNRVPKRIKDMLSCESGCNDGVSFPFLYIGLYTVVQSSAGLAIKDWVLLTLLWQCALGTFLGLVIGYTANRLLRFSETRNYINDASFFVFYFLLAIFAIGVGSTLGADDFLVAFGAGTGFAWDGWFTAKTHSTKLPEIIDLLLNSSMFVYFGAMIPWSSFSPTSLNPTLTPPKLLALLVLILLFRRIPIVLAVKRFVPDIKTYREALFCGHFGPMGVGALFLVIEARAELETGTSLPKPHPPPDGPHRKAIEAIWPVVCFVVLGSVLVHGLSVAAISLAGHFSRRKHERADVIGTETEPLVGMVHEGGGGESEDSFSEDEAGL
ncbi:hypothetical protein MMC14_007536 [Varicellaria rhodocarpa]|nr:hypothetical protein [Varicellaria rhodocarpa]